jgi:hypothetical protein
MSSGVFRIPLTTRRIKGIRHYYSLFVQALRNGELSVTGNPSEAAIAPKHS